MAWDSRHSRVVEHRGHPGTCPDCPDVCETCRGTGRVFRIERSKIMCYTSFGGYISNKGDWDHGYISTDDILDDIECPECHGEGGVY